MREIIAYNLGARLAADRLSVTRFLDRSARKIWADLNEGEKASFARLGRGGWAHWVRRGYDDATAQSRG